MKVIFCFVFVGFTGIDQAYEAPENPDLSLDTVNRSIKDTMMEVITLLENNVSIFMIFFLYTLLIRTYYITYIQMKQTINSQN